ncbi:MAG: hypothetical protein ABIH11_03855 [Candidatus Altiarchaeota archaeon]
MMFILSACISTGNKPPQEEINHSSCYLVRCSYYADDFDRCVSDGCCQPVYNDSGAYVNCMINKTKSQGGEE